MRTIKTLLVQNDLLLHDVKYFVFFADSSKSQITSKQYRYLKPVFLDKEIVKNDGIQYETLFSNPSKEVHFNIYSKSFI